MKVVLVLCLLAFMSCQKDIMDIAKCLYESPKVKEIIADVMVAIATKDFSKLWPKIQEALPELIPVVIKCVTENDVNLQIVKPIVTKWKYETQQTQIEQIELEIQNLQECILNCNNVDMETKKRRCEIDCGAGSAQKIMDIFK